MPAALLLMSPFDVLASLAMDIYLPVVPIMPGALATSPAAIQLTLSLYMICLGLGQLAFGPISDRIGRRPVLVGGALAFMAASFVLAATSLAPVFLALRVVQALGASAMLIAVFATVRDVYAQRPEGAVIYAMLGSLLSFVPALGPIAGALIANSFGWRAIFVALGILAVVATLNAWPRWRETRPLTHGRARGGFGPILRSFVFWTYTLAFATAMGSFFVFFSTAPRVLIGKAGFSLLGFSLAFASAALVMILTTRFAKSFVARWGIAGSVRRGMAMLLLGAGLLAMGQSLAEPSFVSFVIPMWVIAIGIVFTASVTANGALAPFGETAGTAVALYFCLQSVIVSAAGTLFIFLLDGDTAWPLAGFAASFAIVTIWALGRLRTEDSKL